MVGFFLFMVRLGINKNIVALKNPARGRALNMAEGKGIEPLSVTARYFFRSQLFVS